MVLISLVSAETLNLQMMDEPSCRGGTEVTGDKEGHPHLYKSTLPPVWTPMLRRQGSGAESVFVCVFVCVCRREYLSMCPALLMKSSEQ